MNILMKILFGILVLVLIFNGILDLYKAFNLDENIQEVKCYDKHDNEMKDMVCYEDKFNLYIISSYTLITLGIAMLFIGVFTDMLID